MHLAEQLDNALRRPLRVESVPTQRVYGIIPRLHRYGQAASVLDFFLFLGITEAHLCNGCNLIPYPARRRCSGWIGRLAVSPCGRGTIVGRAGRCGHTTRTRKAAEEAKKNDEDGLHVHQTLRRKIDSHGHLTCEEGRQKA
eukprot:scaffold274513_cov33-Tisochrysis_lutea.AAC.5